MYVFCLIARNIMLFLMLGLMILVEYPVPDFLHFHSGLTRSNTHLRLCSGFVNCEISRPDTGSSPLGYEKNPDKPDLFHMYPVPDFLRRFTP